MKRKPLPLLENVTIIDIAAEGKAVARVDDVVLFVPFAAPGDVVNVQVTKKRRQFMEGYITELLQPSPLRTAPFCKHYGVCGGCKWQLLPDDQQLVYKQKQVEEQLSRIGKFADLKIESILPSAQTKFYRNKLEFTFSHKRWLTKDELHEDDVLQNPEALGFHIPMKFDKVLDIENCYLQAEPSNSIRLAVKKFAIDNQYSFFDLRMQEGLLRNLIIRTANTGEIMVIVVFAENDIEKITALMQHIQTSFPQITSLQYVVNTKRNDTIGDQEVILFAGREYIEETMEDLHFKIGSKSFFQTNSDQALNLYKVTRDYAQLKGDEVVYDLYTGTGTIALFVASKAKKVIGVEYVADAIADANYNAKRNNIENATFYAGDMKDIFTDDFVQKNGAPDIVILDPPRAGVHADVIEVLLRTTPQRIVYVSCNPATQARDVALLADNYCITNVQPVDMFPHTHHVENVICLEKI
ncbi:MAG: 23S rRNA (uracil(1939)-C(5))-methyltransferase RlmD [Bacteroidales bacterium]